MNCNIYRNKLTVDAIPSEIIEIISDFGSHLSDKLVFEYNRDIDDGYYTVITGKRKHLYDLLYYLVCYPNTKIH